ncbi:hypothetical protein KJ980_01635 [Patescibacteria group bacterium]|nr:hypothetical protein [Patescibacteria group bacterium]MBU4016284.1 hypothetical protein [Patescibacteria group bacterium]MBU4098329.1 hypothetical protein [Patescibacteria group bacterium]
MKNVIIVRDRGQITIPDSIRKAVSWVSPMSAVSITIRKPDEIIIQPHQKYVDWDKIWKGIHASRAIRGKGKVSAAKFLEKDRQSH